MLGTPKRPRARLGQFDVERRDDARAGQNALTAVPVRNRTRRTLRRRVARAAAGRKLPDRVNTVPDIRNR
jgi:hypothetical protein